MRKVFLSGQVFRFNTWIMQGIFIHGEKYWHFWRSGLCNVRSRNWNSRNITTGWGIICRMTSLGGWTALYLCFGKVTKTPSSRVHKSEVLDPARDAASWPQGPFSIRAVLVLRVAVSCSKNRDYKQEHKLCINRYGQGGEEIKLKEVIKNKMRITPMMPFLAISSGNMDSEPKRLMIAELPYQDSPQFFIPSVQDLFHLWRLPWLNLQFLRVDHIQEIAVAQQESPLSLWVRDSVMLS